MTDIISAIKAIKADAHVTVDNEDVNQIIWHDGNPTNITNDQILTKQAELQSDYDANQYQRDRKNEYPSLGDVVDAIFKKEAGDSTEFDSLASKRAALKTKYPKET